uniref:Uncharacterized protein LOC104231953 n=1 Tax=Nicotiana sylvestris TaxID=4096 RepID=A0A1U7WXK5_NICSY|nr:PREDICTED: uncharacterized protein LOC104231953 [Nicotiana sylvestris]
MNPMTTAGTEDSENLASINVQNTTAVINPSEISQTGASYVADDFWPGIYLASLQTGGASEPARNNLLQPPVLTDAISPALNPEGNGLIPTSVLQSGLSSPNILQLQQFQFGNSSISNEYGRFPSASRDVNRTPVAVTAHMQTPVCQQRQQNIMNPLFHTSPSAATQDLRTESLDGSNVRSVLERAVFLSWLESASGTHDIVSITTADDCTASGGFPIPWSRESLLEARLGREHSFRPPHARSSRPSRDRSSRPRQVDPSHSFSPLQPSQLVVGHQTPNLRTPYSMSQFQGLTQQSTWNRWEALKRRSSPVGIARATGFAGGQHAPIVATQQITQVVRPFQTPRTPSPLPGNADGFRTPLAWDHRGHTGGTTPVTMSDNSRDSLLDLNWRPTRRMRGSLSGRAYSVTLNQYIHKLTQQAQVPRLSIPPNMPPQLEVLFG